MNNVSLIIVNYNTVDYLHACLASIYRYMPAETEVIVVDNASVDGSCAMVKHEFPQVKLIESSENLGFGLGNDLGVQQATNDYVMLFNSDAVLQMDTAQGLLQYLMANPTVSCVTPRVVLPYSLDIQPKTFGYQPNFKTVFMQSTGLNRLLPNNPFFAGIDGDSRWAREMEVGWVSGVCMLMQREHYLSVGGFDERFFMYCEDIDLCMKLSALGKIVLLDDFDIIHHGGASSKTIESKVRNSVWQQRHLLMIINDHHGQLQAWASKIVIGLGLVVRLSIAFVTKPKIQTNTLFKASLARFKDLLSSKGANA
jgi:GT2 family glycosyltransferase